MARQKLCINISYTRIKRGRERERDKREGERGIKERKRERERDKREGDREGEKRGSGMKEGEDEKRMRRRGREDV